MATMAKSIRQVGLLHCTGKRIDEHKIKPNGWKGIIELFARIGDETSPSLGLTGPDTGRVQPCGEGRMESGAIRDADIHRSAKRTAPIKPDSQELRRIGRVVHAFPLSDVPGA